MMHRHTDGRAARLALGLATTLALSLGACTGTVDSSGVAGDEPAGEAGNGGKGGGGRGGSTPSGGPGAGVDASGPSGTVAMPLRRLTRREYVNTVRDLFGDAESAPELDADPHGESGFSEAPLVSKDTALDLFASAQGIAERAVSQLSRLTTCDAMASGGAACARELVTKLGRRAYRRPLLPTEIDTLLALYTKSTTDQGGSHAEGVRVVLTTMLMSPSFLYHWEGSTEKLVLENGAVRLGPHELAARLSYFLWSSMPDEALFAAADRKELATEAQLAAQVTRMMKDERFSRTIGAFHTEWLDLEALAGVTKDDKLFPNFDASLKEAMIKETALFTSWVFGEGDGTLRTLLTAKKTFANAALAKLYDVTGVTGDAFREISLEGKGRAGLFTQPGLIASHSNAAGSNPARSGKMIFDRFLCQEMEPPPPGAANGFKFDDTLTTRENFAKLESMPTCSGCHKIINPLGYAYEQFDAIGKTRDKELGKPVDASGSLTGAAGQKRFANAAELAGQLADSAEAQSCIGTMWYRFAVGRPETTADAPALARAQKALLSSKLDQRALLAAIATSSTFRYRTLEAGETP